MKKLPMREPLLKHAMFLDVQQRVECGVEDVVYFVNRLVGSRFKTRNISLIVPKFGDQSLFQLHKVHIVLFQVSSTTALQWT